MLPNGDRVVPFGDGGSMTYPKGYAGVLLDTEAVWGPPPGGGDGDEAGDAAGVVAGAGEGVGGGGGGGENEGNSEENEVEAAKARLAEAQQRFESQLAVADQAAAEKVLEAERQASEHQRMSPTSLPVVQHSGCSVGQQRVPCDTVRRLQLRGVYGESEGYSCGECAARLAVL